MNENWKALIAIIVIWICVPGLGWFLYSHDIGPKDDNDDEE